jgi:hypothetical protein
VFDWLSGIGDFFGSAAGLLDAVYQALVFIWDTLVAVINWLVGVLQAVFTFLFQILQGIWKVLQHIWTGFFKPLLTRIANVIIRAHQWLEDKLAPVLKWLHKVRAYLDRIFKLYVKPILNTIQHIRRVLLVLRLLHVKWAAALDRRLLQIETDIAKVFLTIRGHLNQLIDVVNALANPPKLARIIAATIGGRRVFAAMTRLWTGLPLGHFFPNYAAGALPWEKPVTRSSQLTDPISNPPASVILGSTSVADFFTPAEGDPVPTDSDIDASADSFLYGQVFQLMSQQEAAIEAGPSTFYDPVSSLQTGRGYFAGAAVALTDVMAGDIAELIA